MTESFLPRVNGVTNSVCRVLDHLACHGHEALVVAPAPGPETHGSFPVRLMRAAPLPFYRSFTVGLPTRRVAPVLREFRPDVVHVTSPVLLGASGITAARRLDLPTVAVFQTDVAGFARRYGWRSADRVVWPWLRRVHSRADRTLAPSTATLAELERRGIPRLARWPRGVDLDRFNPCHRLEAFRQRACLPGEVLVGYVGRLAAEKRVHLLGQLSGLRGIRLVIVGDGPQEPWLRRALPHAAFLGLRTGEDLSMIMASLDVFVHTGANETFCQAVQEALASGLPVVAPAAGGPLDLVRPGHNGLLYPPDDVGAMRAAVATLVGDPSERRRLGDNARQSVLGRSWETVCRELVRHYSEAVTGTTQRQAPAAIASAA